MILIMARCMKASAVSCVSLIIDGHSSITANPCEGSFDNPSDGRRLKSGLVSFDDIKFTRAMVLRNRSSAPAVIPAKTLQKHVTSRFYNGRIRIQQAVCALTRFKRIVLCCENRNETWRPSPPLSKNVPPHQTRPHGPGRVMFTMDGRRRVSCHTIEKAPS